MSAIGIKLTVYNVAYVYPIIKEFYDSDAM